MISTTLNNIELPATDLAVAKSFYADHFGWSFTDYGPTYSAARIANGLEVGLNTGAIVGRAQADGAEDPTGPLVLFETDALEAMHTRLARGKGVIVTAPFAFPGGRRLHFRDPSGNVLGVYELSAP